MIVEDSETKSKLVVNKPYTPEEKKALFLQGLEIIFRNWTALRMLLDSNGAFIYNSIQEVLNDKEEVVEELEFNIVVGTVYEEVCSILVRT